MNNINNFMNNISGHERAYLYDCDKIDEFGGVTYEYSKIHASNANGIPVCFRRNQDDKKLYVTLTENSHAIILGATGSGKTTGFINDFLHLQAELSNSSLVVNDPKGELYSGLADKFRDKGYRVLALNFRDPCRSECWNPMTRIYRIYDSAFHVKDTITAVEENNEFYNVLDGVKYNDATELERAIFIKSNNLLAEAENELSKIVSIYAPIGRQREPEWLQNAKNILKGIFYAMLEDSQNPKAEIKITIDNFSMQSAIAIFDSFSEDSNGSFNDHGYFTNRPKTSQAFNLVKASLLDNATATRRGVLFTFCAVIQCYRNLAVKRLTCADTIDIESFDDKKTVIFMQYRDESSEHYEIIEQFMVDLYSKLIDVAMLKGGSLDRPFYFVWDEFGNFPEIANFGNIMTICRSRNIWILLVLQDYAQLNALYGDYAKVICNNANIRMYCGSNDFDTMCAFSKECLTTSQLSPYSAMCGHSECVENFNEIIVPIVTISDLNEIKEGVYFVKCFRKNALKSWFERSYNCEEFNYSKANINNYICSVNTLDDKYSVKIKSDRGDFLE